jgi:hypothetical protein
VLFGERLQASVAVRVFLLGDERAQDGGFGDNHTTPDHFFTLTQQIKHHDQRGPAVNTAPLRIKIDEHDRVAGIFGDRL